MVSKTEKSLWLLKYRTKFDKSIKGNNQSTVSLVVFIKNGEDFIEPPENITDVTLVVVVQLKGITAWKRSMKCNVLTEKRKLRYCIMWKTI